VSDILGRRRPVGFCERILSHKRWNPVSDMSAPRPTPTASRGATVKLLYLPIGEDAFKVGHVAANPTPRIIGG
jgi:hypothetical protein